MCFRTSPHHLHCVKCVFQDVPSPFTLCEMCVSGRPLIIYTVLNVFQDVPSSFTLCEMCFRTSPHHLHCVKCVSGRPLIIYTVWNVFQDVPSSFTLCEMCFRTSPHLQPVWERYMGTLIACVLRMYPRSWRPFLFVVLLYMVQMKCVNNSEQCKCCAW